MRLEFVSTPGCRLPAGTRAPLTALARALAPERLPVQVVVGRDALLRRLNRSYRRRDRPTDVLSFAYEAGAGAALGDGPAGEIYVSLDRAIVQARAARHATRQEFALLVLHGLLHLQGHDHETTRDARRMRAAEQRALRRLAHLEPRLVARPMLTVPDGAPEAD